MMKISPHFARRDPANIPASELRVTAEWWARNAVIMSRSDPWRSHLAMLPVVALIAPSAAVLAKWLEHAHNATCGGKETTVYHQAYHELCAANPPWSAASNMGDGPQLSEQHAQKWSRDMCLAEMAFMLDEIRADMGVNLTLAKGNDA